MMTVDDDGQPGGSAAARERLGSLAADAAGPGPGATGASAKASSPQLRVTINVSSSERRLSDDVRASLEAVRAAQLAARRRARRETLRVRVVAAGIAAVVIVGVFVVRPRLRAGRVALAATPTKVSPALPQTDSSGASAAARVAGTTPAGGLLAAGVSELPVRAPAAFPPVVADAVECHDHYANKRWKAAADSCTAAFAAKPDDAELALHATEALYARDRLSEARDWAQRTLALAPNQAVALGILGRVERRSGDLEAAARTFRRYLAVAPRGWQAPEAHAACAPPDCAPPPLRRRPAPRRGRWVRR